LPASEFAVDNADPLFGIMEAAAYFSAVLGFESEADAETATLLIKNATVSKRK
jgi:hypothetical protein